jgi:hypothetical protein
MGLMCWSYQHVQAAPFKDLTLRLWPLSKPRLSQNLIGECRILRDNPAETEITLKGYGGFRLNAF